ncbi:MAG: Asp-tRNA(Asn)/Glu-tRNA(Gln) amidotransferase subunit GatB [Bacillota bacterium]|nr:Asp-tRNA(Asn)/Glu-tRNA(Gln) amidotransferase subunit GatB [Bacillota bacterium]
MGYEMTIGLETHVELSTKTKIFCSCTTEFGGDPNTHCCPVCIGLPGSLPKLNRAVVEYAVKAGLATNCEIGYTSKMDRKNYVYPDLSKAYQISQLDYPLCKNGHMTLSDGQTIRLNRIHIEEDAGKLVHSGNDTNVDYNRGGVPLIEIVTEPDFHSAQQVREYLENLRLIMKTLDVSDCKMQEGSMRCDVNISIRRTGDKKLGTRTEIKNMNSLSFISKAIESEYNRQVDALECGEQIIQETRRFNESTGETESMRGKEDSNDYRYFGDPDLPIVYISPEEVEQLRASMPELPDQKQVRYMREYGLSDGDSMQIIRYTKLALYYEKMVDVSGAPKLAANLLITQLFRVLEDEEAKENASLPIPAEYIGEVLKLVNEGKISNNFIKKILDEMLEKQKPFAELFKISDFSMADESETESFVDAAIAESAAAVQDYLAGKEKAIFAIIGKVMKASKGKADAKTVEEMIIKKIKN